MRESVFTQNKNKNDIEQGDWAFSEMVFAATERTGETHGKTSSRKNRRAGETGNPGESIAPAAVPA
jgi:hypothetical protein